MPAMDSGQTSPRYQMQSRGIASEDFRSKTGLPSLSARIDSATVNSRAVDVTSNAMRSSQIPAGAAIAADAFARPDAAVRLADGDRDGRVRTKAREFGPVGADALLVGPHAGDGETTMIVCRRCRDVAIVGCDRDGADRHRRFDKGRGADRQCQGAAQRRNRCPQRQEQQAEQDRPLGRSPQPRAGLT